MKQRYGFVVSDFLMNKINFVGGDKLLQVFKHGFLRSEENEAIFSSDLRKPCLKTGESLSPPTKLNLFMRKSLTTLLKQDEKSLLTGMVLFLLIVTGKFAAYFILHNLLK